VSQPRFKLGASLIHVGNIHMYYLTLISDWVNTNMTFYGRLSALDLKAVVTITFICEEMMEEIY
jgi:hypothetical protein